jgi:acyl-CoA reductase-like NAD-dependent aldehyde dehydrogenase
VYESFLARLVDEVHSLGVGDPEDDDVLVGPVIDEVARDRILAWIDEAKASGAMAIVGGTATGLLVKPTVLVDADIGM